MNPYEPSQVAELQPDPTSELIAGSPWPVWRTIFWEWEQRRLIYNGVLIAIVLVGVGIQGFGRSIIQTMIDSVFAGLAANCCYVIGPLFESYVTWLQGRRVVSLGKSLFVAGLSFSIVVTYMAFMMRAYLMNGGM